MDPLECKSRAIYALCQIFKDEDEIDPETDRYTPEPDTFTGVQFKNMFLIQHKK